MRAAERRALAPGRELTLGATWRVCETRAPVKYRVSGVLQPPIWEKVYQAPESQNKIVRHAVFAANSKSPYKENL